MFVRRKANKRGTISVQVIDKSGGRYKVVKSFGIGRTEVEIARLEELARQFVREKAGLGQNRAKKDEFNRKRGIGRLQKRVNDGKLTKSNINNKGYNKYLKMEGGEDIHRHG